jgi:MinD-like ATPase involved in chromosome partitioning or flagellar assembly
MILSVASGKGGTGTKTIAINLALAIERDCEVQFLNYEVKALNTHLFLNHNLHIQSLSSSLAYSRQHALHVFLEYAQMSVRSKRSGNDLLKEHKQHHNVILTNEIC